MTSPLPAAFYRAEAAYLAPPDEDDPECPCEVYDCNWCDAVRNDWDNAGCCSMCFTPFKATIRHAVDSAPDCNCNPCQFIWNVLEEFTETLARP